MRDSRTPSAAVGSSRITTFDANAAARLTATAWRWPPDMSPTTALKSGSVTCSRSSTSRVASVICRRFSTRSERGSQRRPGELAAGVEVVGRPQVVEQREILVDGLDPERARVGRRVDRDRRAVHLDRAAVEPVHAAQALDQRRLAGAVVAEQREHLAAAHVEVDPVERGDRAEALASLRAPRAPGRSATDGRGERAHACLVACATRTRPST